MDPRLSEIFGAAMPVRHDDRLDALSLGAALHEYLEAARAAWPNLRVADAEFVRHLAGRAKEGNVPPRAHAGDMLLAFACAHGTPGAVEAFHKVFAPVIARVLSRRGAEAPTLADATQIVHERLLIAPPGGVPKISEYRGIGPLRSWVSTVAATTLLMIRRTAERRREEHDSSQVARLAADLDPELAYLKDRYATEMEQAVVHALAHLSDRERTLMRLHLGEHMTIDQLGAMYRVNRATAARWLTAARESLVARARSDLRLRLRLSESECDSIVALVRSQLDVSIVRRLS